MVEQLYARYYATIIMPILNNYFLGLQDFHCMIPPSHKTQLKKSFQQKLPVDCM